MSKWSGTAAWKSLEIKQGWYHNLSAGAGTWCDENFIGDWNFHGNGQGIHVIIEKEEDVFLFVMKYGDYIA